MKKKSCTYLPMQLPCLVLCFSVRAIFPFDIIGSYQSSFTISYSVYLLVISSFNFFISGEVFIPPSFF